MIKANFKTYASYVTDSIYQWELNQVLSVYGLNLGVAPEVHFSNANMDRAIVRQATLTDNIVNVDIPNSLLQEPLPIKAHIGFYDGKTFKVAEVVDIPVIARKRPSDYQIQDSDEEIYSFKALENALANRATNARVDNIIAHNNDTEGNTELVDMRIGVDGTHYGSAGQAVRYQIGEVKNCIPLTYLTTGIATNTGYYKETNAFNSSRTFAVGITVETDGKYTVQTGTEIKSSAMVDTLCSDTEFKANVEKIIYGYKPSGNYQYIRLSKDINWTVKIYEISDNSIENKELHNVMSDLMTYIESAEYVESPKTLCPKKFTTMLEPSKKYAFGITVSTSGFYDIKAGTSGAIETMVDTICENKRFIANEESIFFGYTPSVRLSRLRISHEVEWDIKLYEVVESEQLLKYIQTVDDNVTNIQPKIDILINNIMRVIDKGVPVSDVNYYYNRVLPLDPNKMYAFGITVETSGNYTITSGTYSANAYMVDTICEDMNFVAGEEKIIFGYKPTGRYSYIRLSKDIKWSLNIYSTSVDTEYRDIMANKYENELNRRELYLRQYHSYKDDEDIYYGVEWIENEVGVTQINTEGYESLHTELPIQSKMRRCVVKDGVLQYYLHADDSTKKEDDTLANLDGTDGDVCVEIPEFFYKFEEFINETGNRVIRLKISEQGINGFSYSPKMYVGAYEATIDRDTNILASVCTTEFGISTEEIKITSETQYSVDDNGYSLGKQTVVTKSGYTPNATTYRGGNNDASFDDVVNPTDDNYWRNQLGLPVARLSRDACRRSEDIRNGKLMYLYDTHRALFILSMVEFPLKNIQTSIGSGGLGRGATVYYAYDAYKQWQNDYTESIIPCGVTNSLGNHSGEVFIKLNNVPLSIEGNYPDADISTIGRGDLWVPCMSYRGVEHYYGHLYKTLDQITLAIENTGETTTDDGKPIYNVAYYYQKNPFRTDNLMNFSELINTFKLSTNIRNTISYILGMDGHILPIETTGSKGYEDESTYCDCTEFNHCKSKLQIDVNGSILSGKLVGRNFMVGCFESDDEDSARVSNGTRITYVGVK